MPRRFFDTSEPDGGREHGIGMVMERVAVVAAERTVGSALVSVLTELGVPRITLTLNPDQARELLREGVDAAFLFAELPEHLALSLLRDALSACPLPRLIVVSNGAHPDLFTLARAGAQEHLHWPASSEQVRRCLELPATSSVLEEGARFLVGRIGISKAQADLRRLMLQRALDATSGSRRAAARMLGVTRAAVQHMLKEKPLDESGKAGAKSEPPPPHRPSGIVPAAHPAVPPGGPRKTRRSA
jgi:DNA-binding NtrC family response regulator